MRGLIFCKDLGAIQFLWLCLFFFLRVFLSWCREMNFLPTIQFSNGYTYERLCNSFLSLNRVWEYPSPFTRFLQTSNRLGRVKRNRRRRLSWARYTRFLVSLPRLTNSSIRSSLVNKYRTCLGKIKSWLVHRLVPATHCIAIYALKTLPRQPVEVEWRTPKRLRDAVLYPVLYLHQDGIVIYDRWSSKGHQRPA